MRKEMSSVMNEMAEGYRMHMSVLSALRTKLIIRLQNIFTIQTIALYHNGNKYNRSTGKIHKAMLHQVV
jgi:hypothetical protein